MPDFGFKFWPFQISAGPDSGAVWADRESLRKDLDNLVAAVKPGRPTTLINLWAYYGAGKTYALRYVQHRAKASGIFSIYCTCPQGATGFGNLYRAIVSALGADSRHFPVIEDALREARTDIGQSIGQACRFLSMGNPAQAAEAFSYLSGQKTTQKKRRDIGVTADLADANIAGGALTEMLAALGAHSGVLLLLDEVQDLVGMRDRALAETTGVLQKVFDGVPHGLRLVASFTTHVKETIKQVIGPALTNRSSKTLELPEFSPSEAVGFLADLVRLAREENDSRPYYPFSMSDFDRIVAQAVEAGEKLLPRALIIRANNQLESLEADDPSCRLS